MIWIFYNIIFTVVFLTLLPIFFKRMRKRGGYRKNFLQRFGIYGQPIRKKFTKNRIWIHAVSVGEVSIAFSFMDAWRKKHPHAKFVVSVITSTARNIAQKRMKEEDVLIYFPVDFPPIVRRIVRLIKPSIFIVVETEIWPNLIRQLNKRGVPVCMINGRISDRSYTGYKKARMFTRRIFPLFNLLCMQSEKDKDRVLFLGALPEKTRVLQSAKYETPERDKEKEESASALLKRIGFQDNHIVLMGASTWPKEEKALVDIYRELRNTFPHLKLMLVPRHFERTPEILKEISSDDLKILRKTELNGHQSDTACDIFLLDTTGEMLHYFPSASIVFVGKSLFALEGQNIIEPAATGKPVIVGPNMKNFNRIVSDFLQANALTQVADVENLKIQIREFIEHPEVGQEQGHRAIDLINRNAGAIKHAVELLENIK